MKVFIVICVGVCALGGGVYMFAAGASLLLAALNHFRK